MVERAIAKQRKFEPWRQVRKCVPMGAEHAIDAQGLCMIEPVGRQRDEARVARVRIIRPALDTRDLAGEISGRRQPI